MKGGGRILTLTFLGSDRVFPNYNVMGVAKAALESSTRYLASELGPQGITVNAISAGPVKTLAAAGISGFSTFLKEYADRAPIRRNIDANDVAAAALALLGPAGRASRLSPVRAATACRPRGWPVRDSRRRCRAGRG